MAVEKKAKSSFFYLLFYACIYLYFSRETVFFSLLYDTPFVVMVMVVVRMAAQARTPGKSFLG